MRSDRVRAESGHLLYLDSAPGRAAGLGESDFVRKDPIPSIPSLLLHKEMDVGFFTEPTASNMIRQDWPGVRGHRPTDHDIQVILVFTCCPARQGRAGFRSPTCAARTSPHDAPELTEVAKRH